jgi:hypothetical protein
MTTSNYTAPVKKQRPSGVLDDRLLRREIDIGKRVADSGSEMLLPVIDAADVGDALLLVMPLAGPPGFKSPILRSGLPTELPVLYRQNCGGDLF